MNVLLKIIVLLVFSLAFYSCGNNIFRKVDTREVPINSQERARKNVEEGRGVSVGNILKNRSTNYEFSTSNPMWRASLEILDFLPLATVDYSGGIIITDWYNDNNNKNSDSLKITIRFLNNDIKTNSLKIIVHKKKCDSSNNCIISEIDSKIKEELIKTILTKASEIELEQKKIK